MSDKNYNVLVNWEMNDELSPQASVMADALGEVNEELEDQEAGTKKAEKGWASLAKAVGLTALAYKGLALGKNAIANFKEQDKANRLTTISFGENATAVHAYASGLQELTGIGDETSLMYLSMLKNMGLTKTQSEELLEASANLVAGSGGLISMEMALKNLARSYSGTAGRLTEFIPELKELTAEQLKAGGAVDLVAKKYDGMAQAMMDSPTGDITRLTNTIGDLSEDIGEDLIPAQIEWLEMQKSLMIVVKEMSPVIQGIAKGISLFANGVQGLAESNKIVLGLAGAIGVLALGMTGAIPTITTFNAVISANPIGAWTIAITGAVIAVDQLSSAIAGGFEDSTEASNEFLTASNESTQKIVDNLQQITYLQKNKSMLNKEEKSELKALKKATEDLTGENVSFSKATGEAILKQKTFMGSGMALETTIATLNGRMKANTALQKRATKAQEEKAKVDEKARADAKRAIDIERQRQESLKARETEQKKAIALTKSLEDEILLVKQTGSDRQVLAIELQYEKELELLRKFYGESSDEISNLEAVKTAKIIELRDAEQIAKLDQVQAHLDEEQALRDQKEEERKTKDAQSEQLRRDSMAQTIDIVTQGANAVSDIWGGVTDKKRKNLDRESKAQIEAVKKSTKTEEQKSKEIQAIEKKASDERYKLALSDWRNALIMSVANTALGVTKTLATMGYPAGIPFGIALGVTGGISTGIIASNKPEKMSEGGVHPGGSTVSDSVPTLINPGERVINKGRTRKLDRLIDSGELGGKTEYNIEAPIVIQGNATPEIIDQLRDVSNEYVDKVLRALEIASEQNKIDPSRFAFATA